MTLKLYSKSIHDFSLISIFCEPHKKSSYVFLEFPICILGHADKSA